ncbi:hypothetical protein VCHA31O73_360007 [Vibrio chagasii]|nr:hypothetical protein VCHA31O73_360007 [Vibrio chagasii]
MAIFLNTNDEQATSSPVTLQTTRITMQVSTVGGEKGTLMPRVAFLVKLPNPPSGAPSPDADFSIVESVNPNGVYNLTLPQGSEIRVDMSNNQRKCNVRVWGAE